MGPEETVTYLSRCAIWAETLHSVPHSRKSCLADESHTSSTYFLDTVAGQTATVHNKTLSTRSPRRLWIESGGIHQAHVKRQMVTPQEAIRLRSPGNTEPCAEVPVVRPEPEATGGTGVARPAVPGTAPKDTDITGLWAGWVVYRGFGVVFIAVPIGAPLAGISVHVVKTEGIGLELFHRRREHIAVAGGDNRQPTSETVRTFLGRANPLEHRLSIFWFSFRNHDGTIHTRH